MFSTESFSIFYLLSLILTVYFRVFFLGRFRQVIQSIFAAIMPSPLPRAGTTIIGRLAVKERGRGIYPTAEVFSFEFHRLENITRDEPINLAW